MWLQCCYVVWKHRCGAELLAQSRNACDTPDKDKASSHSTALPVATVFVAMVWAP